MCLALAWLAEAAVGVERVRRRAAVTEWRDNIWKSRDETIRLGKVDSQDQLKVRDPKLSTRRCPRLTLPLMASKVVTGMCSYSPLLLSLSEEDEARRPIKVKWSPVERIAECPENILFQLLSELALCLSNESTLEKNSGDFEKQNATKPRIGVTSFQHFSTGITLGADQAINLFGRNFIAKTNII